MGDKIGFGDLSVGLKIPIVMAWVFGLIYLISFLVVFIVGLTNPSQFI